MHLKINKIFLDTHKPEDDQLIVHCTIFGNPEPDIKWFFNKIPLNLCLIPRYQIYNHPDDLHEHIVASLVITGPSYLDNGEYVIELRNEAGFERRTLNAQFQTEEEYNAIYFKKYMEHKENWKYHEYQPGEVRWEDRVPDVKEFKFPDFVFAEEKVGTNGKKKKMRKKRIKVQKKVMTAWGDEKTVEVSTEGSEEEEITDDDESQLQKESDNEEKEEEGWGPPTEDEEEEVAPQETSEIVQEQNTETKTEEVASVPETQSEIVDIPETQTEIVAEPISESPPVETEPIQIEEASGGIEEPSSDNIQEITEEVEDLTVEDYQPSVRQKVEEVEHPIILHRPKFYITDFQLRKKFFFVNKLIDVELLKGKTLRLESISSSLGPVTAEWRFNGRLLSNTARRQIEFYPRKNFAAIEIENTRVQDSGTYTVTFYNDYTEPLIDSCKVNIFVAQPKETADQPPTFTRLLTGINHYKLLKF